MKKTAIIFLTLCFLLLTAGSVRAQNLTFDRAYQDYQYNLTIYDNAYSDYTDAKNAYLQGGKTLEEKDIATQKTYTMLVDRDQLMVIYLTALRAKIAELSGLSNDFKNAIFTKIDTEVNFYSNHKSQYHSNDTLDQLFATSSQSESQYKNTTSLIVNEALFDISLGEEAGIRVAQENIYSSLKTFINAGVAAGKLTLDPFNHWFVDIDSTDALLVQNETKAQNQIQQMYAQSYSAISDYNNATNTLSASIRPLNQFNEFLTEVVNYIKNQP